ncbi:MAG: hypothetical protein M1831_006957 [Alyxoria varia]|nr:MAG: hypothetical protein M1831_006957 [Alyxoria varia]
MELGKDDKELQQIGTELHTDIVPGTEIMIDVGRHQFVKNSQRRVLVPQPSDDPHDPLNWSSTWKLLCIINISWLSFVQGYGSLSLAPMLPSYIAEWGVSLEDAIQLTAIPILVLGFSNFIWVPMSNTFGRRPTLITSQLINLASAIWRAEATSYESFLGACALGGFASGPAETIQPAITADLFFLHDRGKWNTFYFLVYFGGLTIGPIFSGPMADGNWRNFWWLYVGVNVLSVLMCIFIGPESRYPRPHPKDLQQLPSDSTPSDTGKGSIKDSDELSDSELHRKIKTPSAPEKPRQKSVDQSTVLGHGRPSRAQFGLFQHNPAALKSLALNFWIPWRMFAFPIAQFASFVVSWSASVFLMVNLTQAQVFSAPPYNFSQTTVGLFNFATFVGMLIGLFSAGPLSDWFAMRATLKNGGVREPEMRLPAMIPYVLVMILGNVVLAVGYQDQWAWPAIVVLGFGCIGVQVTSIPAFASTYAVDSYKPAAGSLFVAITVNKNLWGYGLGKFITPWTISSGYIKPIMLNMCLTVLFCSTGVIFYFYGKTFRRWTRNSSIHALENS